MKSLPTLIGIGSWLGSDDRAGLLLVRALGLYFHQTRAFPKLLRPSCDALTLVSELLALDSEVVVVDCANMGLAAGSTRFFADHEAMVGKAFDSVSCHGFGMGAALNLARGLGFEKKVWFFGLQPWDLSISDQVSPDFRFNFSAILGQLNSHLTEFLHDHP